MEALYATGLCILSNETLQLQLAENLLMLFGCSQVIVVSSG